MDKIVDRTVFAKESEKMLEILTAWCNTHNVSFSGIETAVIISAMEEYKNESTDDDNDEYFELCPNCGGRMVEKMSGIKCSDCSYWVCY